MKKYRIDIYADVKSPNLISREYITTETEEQAREYATKKAGSNFPEVMQVK